MSELLAQGILDPAHMFGMRVLPLNVGADGSGQIIVRKKIKTLPDISKNKKEALFIRFGEEFKFFGLGKNRILPVVVKNKAGEEKRVWENDLGVTEEMVQSVWDSRTSLSKCFGDLYGRATMEALDHFPPPVAELVRSKGQGFFYNEIDLWTLLTCNKVPGQYWEETFSVQDEQVRRLAAQDTTIPGALIRLVETLQAFYETAKEKNRNIYHY